MKKLLTFAAAAALALSLVSCGSTGGAEKAPPGVPPRQSRDRKAG